MQLAVFPSFCVGSAAESLVLRVCSLVEGIDVEGRVYMLQKWLVFAELVRVASVKDVQEKTCTIFRKLRRNLSL